jgi:hypothetical protein
MKLEKGSLQGTSFLFFTPHLLSEAEKRWGTLKTLISQ